MKLIGILLALLISIILCKGFSLLEILLSLFTFAKIKNKSLKQSDELLSDISERKLLISLIVIYLIANIISTLCMYGILNLLNFDYVLAISISWFILRTIITFIRFKNKWKDFIKDKIKLIQNKK